MMMPLHVRMARAALGWSLQDLAEKAKVNLNTISRYETGREIKSGTLESIESAFTAAGVVLIYEDANGGIGVRLSRELMKRVRATSTSGEKPTSRKRRQKAK